MDSNFLRFSERFRESYHNDQVDTYIQGSVNNIKLEVFLTERDWRPLALFQPFRRLLVLSQ